MPARTPSPVQRCLFSLCSRPLGRALAALLHRSPILVERQASQCGAGALVIRYVIIHRTVDLRIGTPCSFAEFLDIGG